MKLKTPDLQRLIGVTLMSALLGLIVYGGISRNSMPGDPLYWLIRWPFWLAAFVVVPLITLRLTLWNRRRRKAPGTQSTSGADSNSGAGSYSGADSNSGADSTGNEYLGSSE